MSAYLELVGRGALQLSPLVSHRVPIDAAESVYQDLLSKDRNVLLTILEYAPPAHPSHVLHVHSDPIDRDRVRVALVGAGGFAKSTHLPLLKELSAQYQLRAVVSRSGPNAAEMARKFGAAFASVRYQDILEDPDVDAVLIATRHHLHGEMVLAALAAGKHVFVEKPLALSEEELARIESYFGAPGAQRLVLLTGFNRRFSRIAAQLKNAVQGRSNPMMINYRMNAGYQPPESWLHGAEGGGRNRGEACHIYDLFTFLTDSRAVKVDYSAIRPATGYYRSDDNFVCTVRYEDGSAATLTYTGLGSRKFPKEQMEVFCDGWVASMNDYKTLEFHEARFPGVRSRTMEKGHREELEAFARAVLNGGEWPIPLWQQIQATKISFQGGFHEQQLACVSALSA
jgi:predicted dehydrogenase